MNVIPADALVGRTLASDVLFRLRNDILQATLRPGERLRFAALRSLYGVSVGTLREALAHLVQEGLVTAEGQRGFCVTPASRRDLLELTETRVLIEREALRLAILRGDAAWEAAVRSTHEALRRSALAADRRRPFASPAWQRDHHAFHQALVAACGSNVLLNVRAVLRQRAERYRGLAHHVPPSAQEPAEDHAPLLDTALARDAEAACEMVEKRMRATAAMLLAGAPEFLSAH